MTEEMEHFDEDLEVSEKLSADLDSLFKPQLSVPPEVDRAILDQAARHFAGRESNKVRRHRLLRRVGSIAAACAVVGISLWLALSNPTRPEESTPQQVASVPASSVKIELLSETGRVAIAAGQAVSTLAGELKTLVINDRHRLVMNADTTLSVKPLSQNKRPGCVVNLSSGQIYAHVQHDGSPFVVATAHGRAVITGTTFDVKATESGTTLVVADGRVRFESQQGVAEVAAGQISEIVANAAPTRPRSCDATTLTAWATHHDFKTALAKLEPYSDDYDLTDLWLSANSGPIDLGNIDYRDWIEEKRPWFEREFPWIFQLQAALAAEGIEADYPQLLLSSGDIWQFAYPETSPQQIPVAYLGPLLKTASKYGFDEHWLTASVPAAKFAIDSLVGTKGRFTGSEALEAWASRLENVRKSSGTPDSATLLYSLHASAYLANTRTLVWLRISNGKTDVSATDRANILASLQTEVNTAYELSGRIIRLFAGVTDEPCDECQMQFNGIIENITTITGIEKGIKEHEGLK